MQVKKRVFARLTPALVLSGRRAKKPIHDGSQKNELNGYGALNELKELLGDAVTLVVETSNCYITGTPPISDN
jgi:hypothetical protein